MTRHHVLVCQNLLVHLQIVDQNVWAIMNAVIISHVSIKSAKILVLDYVELIPNVVQYHIHQCVLVLSVILVILSLNVPMLYKYVRIMNIFSNYTFSVSVQKIFSERDFNFHRYTNVHDTSVCPIPLWC